MSADVLRAAATKLREAAEAATEGPWVVTVDTYGSDVGNYEAASIDRVAGETYCAEEGYSAPFSVEDATYIALANPVFGLAVADWLEHDARLFEEADRVKYYVSTRRRENALAVARSIVGGDE